MPPRSKRSAAGPKEAPAVKEDAPIAKPSVKGTKSAPKATKEDASKAVTLATRVKTTTPAPAPAPVPEPSKKRTGTREPAARPAKRVKTDTAINLPPAQKLDVYVFGSGDTGELGLGNVRRDGKKPKNVFRPRLNDLLSAGKTGIVQIAVGGMHCVALSYDNKLYTWGVNDNGALGRDTSKDPKETEDAESDSDSDDDDIGLNAKESTPAAIPSKSFPEGTKFAQVVAGGSHSFVLTTTGLVYGWGTFLGADGVIGFTKDNTVAADKAKPKRKDIQRTPLLIPELKQIKFLAAGHNHIQALDHKGNVFSWGCGEQNQLGRQIVSRTRANALVPSQFGLPKRKIKDIACGDYHSFAIDDAGHVFTWGLNNFGQTGISDNAGKDGAIITTPTVIQSLSEYKIKQIQGGCHHSIACTEDHEVLVWGRCDDSQAGIPLDEIPKEDLITNESGKPRILAKPTVVPDITGFTVAAGIDNCLAISSEGEAYSWGFSANYRTGLGTDDSIEEPTKLENTALKGKKLTFAGCGGQFSVLAGPAADSK